MKLTFYGAAGTVTGSKHLLEVNGIKILLDCGLFQGSRAESAQRNRKFGFDPNEIDIMILSHAHIDHSGAIPSLIKHGFSGDIICTPATRALCATMLPDSGYIQQRDVEFLNKRNARRKDQVFEVLEPLYTHEDALASLEYFTTRNYHRPSKIAEGVTLTFYDAGHMLGSAIVVLDIEDQDDGQSKRLVFSGDLGRAGIPIIRDPEYIDGADVLILESTYGDKLHEPVYNSEKKLEKIIVDTYKRGGSIVMPAFAVGRTQQLVYTLHKLSIQGDIPSLPIYVDSPLAVDTTAVFGLHPECYDEEAREFLQDTRNMFGFDDLTYIRRVEDSKRLNHDTHPSIIISASGMAEFGRVVHHLAHRIDDPKNTVLITGWQAPNTLGRRLVEKVDKVRILGEEYPRLAQVEVLNGFSGHADRDELLEWVGHMNYKPKRTFLVHGEPEPANALKGSLEREFNLTVDVALEGVPYHNL